ncbi:hypothetical protein JCM11491_006031 [Sporobolomyces phaffii]
MAKTTKPGFYAVKVGRVPGVYKTWDECRAQVDGFQGGRHKKFPTLVEAQAFVKGLALPTVATASTAPNGKGKGKGRALEQDEAPAAKRQKTSKAAAASDVVFRSQEAKFPASRTVYSDGSSKGNGKKGAVAGSGVFWSHELGAKNLSERLPGKLQTNNRAEMYAVARILETDPHPEQPLLICTDSKYTIEVFTSYIPGWRARGWKTSGGQTPMNSDLIKYILSLLALRTLHTSSSSSSSSSSCMANVKFKWIKGHAGQEGNEMADKLANQGAQLPVAVARDFDQLARDNEQKLRDATTTATNKTTTRGGAARTIDDVTWAVETCDLLSDAELKELERTQEF